MKAPGTRTLATLVLTGLATAALSTSAWAAADHHHGKTSASQMRGIGDEECDPKPVV